MNTYSKANDLTHKQPAAGGGHGNTDRMFTLCGHKGSTTGALVRNLGAGPQYLRCARCMAARSA
jgi:hypothetical protein